MVYNNTKTHVKCIDTKVVNIIVVIKKNRCVEWTHYKQMGHQIISDK